MEPALFSRFRQEGWSLNEQATAAYLAAECGGGGAPSFPRAPQTLLNADLRQLGVACLPEGIARADCKKVAGPLVLQVSEVRDVSQPSCAAAAAAGERRGRILRLLLTDGPGSCAAVELQPLAATEEQLCPGTKLWVQHATARLGVLLLEPRSLQVLGGRVEALAEAWEVQQRYGGTAADRAEAADAERPPAFRTFDPKLARYGSRRGAAARVAGAAAPAGAAALAPQPPAAAAAAAGAGAGAGVAGAATRKVQGQGGGTTSAAPAAAAAASAAAASAALKAAPGAGRPPLQQQEQQQQQPQQRVRRGAQPYQPPVARQQAEAQQGRQAAAAAEASMQLQQRQPQPQQQAAPPPQQPLPPAAAAAPAPASAQAPAPPAAAAQKLLGRLQAEEGRFGRGQPRRGRRSRFEEDEDDSSMTLEEWEARRKAGGTRDGPGSGTALDPPASTADVSDASLQPQQQQLLSDEELARQLQRQLDLEAAQEWGRPAERYQGQELAASLQAMFQYGGRDGGEGVEEAGGSGPGGYRGRGRGRRGGRDGGSGRGQGRGRGRHS